MRFTEQMFITTKRAGLLSQPLDTWSDRKGQTHSTSFWIVTASPGTGLGGHAGQRLPYLGCAH